MTLAPLTRLPYQTARVVWMAATIGLVALAVMALAGTLPAGNRRTAFVAIAIGMTPLHAGIRTGTVSIAAIALLMLSVWASTRGRALLAGLCIALAALKPQLALPFLAYHVIRRNFHVAGWSIGVWLSLMAIGAARLVPANVPWMTGYVDNMRLVLADPKNVFTADNPLRFQMLNLQPLIDAIVANAPMSDVLAKSIGGALFLGWWIRVRKSDARSELLEVGALSAICLLPIYHRFYDAWLLAIPLCWALSTPDMKGTRAVFAALVLFIIPFVGFAQWLMARGIVPAELASRAWLNATVMSLQMWTLLVLAAALVFAIGRATAAAAETNSRPAAFPQ